MRQDIAKLISLVFHPALVPSYIFGILFFLTRLVPYSDGQKVSLLGMIFLLTFAMPVVLIFQAYKMQWISSLSIPKREERVVPFVVITVVYLVITYFLIDYVHIAPLIARIMIAGSFALIMLTAITLVHKISIHSAGVGGGIGTLLGVQYAYPHENLLYPMLILVLLAGAVLSARLALGAHTPTELLTGFAVGFVFNFAVFLV
jgi:membrane-associated phospholipid phosphatase